MKKEVSELSNPFLKLVDPATLEADIYKSSGSIDIKAAKLAGIDAILSGQVTGYTVTNGKLNKERKKAYSQSRSAQKPCPFLPRNRAGR